MAIQRCPNCGAETSNSICEYCGSEVMSVKRSDSNSNENREESEIFVAPIYCDESTAEESCREFFKRELNESSYKVLNHSLKYDEINANIIFDKVTSYYVPVSLFTKFGELDTYGYLCSESELPVELQRLIVCNCSRFNSDYIGFFDSTEQKKDEELKKVDIVLPVENLRKVPSRDDKFLDFFRYAYVPFYVIKCRIYSESFTVVFCAGEKRSYKWYDSGIGYFVLYDKNYNEIDWWTDGCNLCDNILLSNYSTKKRNLQSDKDNYDIILWVFASVVILFIIIALL